MLCRISVMHDIDMLKIRSAFGDPVPRMGSKSIAYPASLQNAPESNYVNPLKHTPEDKRLGYW